ncbi:IS200/IS605 family transposase [Armatimonas rosea]|uniref:REP element-mobilizing transposase RayT n=1 Tax=Armatimonas rosea TaxID=685828 RepID=A0A7W9SPR6_ARMRO|nr:REP element-mobilizing transposase RayT [Armatimonas rosea]
MKEDSRSQRRNMLVLALHLVWATHERRPLITDDIERVVYHAISAEATQLGCEVLAIGGIADHVHLVVTIPSTLSIAKLMNQIKGSSSSTIRNHVGPGRFFAWEPGYAAFSLSPEHVCAAKAYVLKQKEHHANHTTFDDEEI